MIAIEVDVHFNFFCDFFHALFESRALFFYVDHRLVPVVPVVELPVDPVVPVLFPQLMPVMHGGKMPPPGDMPPVPAVCQLVAGVPEPHAARESAAIAMMCFMLFYAPIQGSGFDALRHLRVLRSSTRLPYL